MRGFGRSGDHVKQGNKSERRYNWSNDNILNMGDCGIFNNVDTNEDFYMITKTIICAISSLAFLWMSIMLGIKGYYFISGPFFLIFLGLVLMTVGEYCKDHDDFAGV